MGIFKSRLYKIIGRSSQKGRDAALADITSSTSTSTKLRDCMHEFNVPDDFPTDNKDVPLFWLCAFKFLLRTTGKSVKMAKHLITQAVYKRTGSLYAKAHYYDVWIAHGLSQKTDGYYIGLTMSEDHHEHDEDLFGFEEREDVKMMRGY